MSSHDNSPSRRDLLRRLGRGATALALLPAARAFAQQDDSAKPLAGLPKTPYSPFLVGVQSYSLRHFSFDEALAKTHDLGLQYVEAYPNHLPMTEDVKEIVRYKNLLINHSIELLAYGVVDFHNDEADARKKFNFAQVMGIRTITAYPRPDALDLLDKLTKEYKINIAIHNHGPGDDLYDLSKKGLAALEGRNPRMGACVDTGHAMRSGEDPVAVVTKFGKRVLDVHLKNAKKNASGDVVFTEVGDPDGLMDTPALLKLLHEQKYKGLISLEYEEHEENPIPYMEKCLAATRQAVATLNAAPKKS